MKTVHVRKPSTVRVKKFEIPPPPANPDKKKKLETGDEIRSATHDSSAITAAAVEASFIEASEGGEDGHLPGLEPPLRGLAPDHPPPDPATRGASEILEHSADEEAAFLEESEGLMNDEPTADDEDDGEPPAKKTKRTTQLERALIDQLELKYSPHKWAMETFSYIKWINHNLDEDTVKNYFRVRAVFTEGSTFPASDERPYRIAFDLNPGVKVELSDDDVNFWDKFGVHADNIGVQNEHEFYADGDQYFHHRAKDGKPTITVYVTVPGEMEEKEVQGVGEPKEYHIPTGFYDSVSHFRETLTHIFDEDFPEGHIPSNIFTLSRMNQMILTPPTGMQVKLNTELAEFMGLPGDEWLMRATQAKKVFTAHPVSTFYVYSNLVAPEITSDKFTSRLYEFVPHSAGREINYLSDCTPHPVEVPMYKDVYPTTLTDITIYITDQFGRDIDFIEGGGETSVVLHIKRDA